MVNAGIGSYELLPPLFEHYNISEAVFAATLSAGFVEFIGPPARIIDPHSVAPEGGGHLLFGPVVSVSAEADTPDLASIDDHRSTVGDQLPGTSIDRKPDSVASIRFARGR